MVEIKRPAIILTHNRPELLKECFEAIKDQADYVLIIDNASSPPVTPGSFSDQGPYVLVVNVPDQPPNLSKLWNLGIDRITYLRHVGGYGDNESWYIAFLCDDAIAPPGWYDAVIGAMEATGAAAGCSSPWGYEHEPRLKTAPDGDIAGRMPGWAWVMDGSKGLRAEERLLWWWCDTDMDWKARAAGGMVMIGGYLVPNMQPNYYTNVKPELGEQTGRDGQMFAEIHGHRPW